MKKMLLELRLSQAQTDLRLLSSSKAINIQAAKVPEAEKKQ